MMIEWSGEIFRLLPRLTDVSRLAAGSRAQIWDLRDNQCLEFKTLLKAFQPLNVRIIKAVVNLPEFPSKVNSVRIIVWIWKYQMYVQIRNLQGPGLKQVGSETDYLFY
jgi:hypothetical protein